MKKASSPLSELVRTISVKSIPRKPYEVVFKGLWSMIDLERVYIASKRALRVHRHELMKEIKAKESKNESIE